MDPTSKIRTSFESPIESNSTPPEKESSQTESPIKKLHSSAATHVQNQNESEATKNIKDQNISSNIFSYSGISTVFHEVRQSDSTPPATEDQLAQANSQIPATGVTQAKASIGPPKMLNSGNQAPSPSANLIKVDVKAPAHIYPKPSELKDLSKFKFEFDDYKDSYFDVSVAGKKLGEKFNLTKFEIGAIRAYTGDSYLFINWQMRNLPDPLVDLYDAKALEKSGVRKDMAELIANLTNGLKKLPSSQSSSTRFKGLGRDANLPADELAKYKKGARVSTPMFTSTTNTLEQMGHDFWWNGSPHAIVIHQAFKGNGRDIGPFSVLPDEAEILFLPNTKFLVTHVNNNVIFGEGVSKHAKYMDDKARSDAYKQGDKKLIKTVISLQELPPEIQFTQKESLFRSSVKSF
jgi:hypothetical protein